MEHLVVIGDSLTQPRSWVGLGIKDTYSYLLQSRFAPRLAVTNLGAPENNTRRQTSEHWVKRTLAKAEADYVAVQLGIVDCAPRLLFEPERLLVAAFRRVPVIRRVIDAYVKLRSRYRMIFTKHVRLVMVPLDEFKSNFETLLKIITAENHVKQIYLINIAYPGAEMSRKSYDVLGNIRPYNEAINDLAARNPEMVKLIDIFSYTEANRGGITDDDGHHLTPISHRFIADEISRDLSARVRGAE